MTTLEQSQNKLQGPTLIRKPEEKELDDNPNLGVRNIIYAHGV